MRSAPPVVALLLVFAPVPGLATAPPLLSYRILLQTPSNRSPLTSAPAGP